MPIGIEECIKINIAYLSFCLIGECFHKSMQFADRMFLLQTQTRGFFWGGGGGEASSFLVVGLCV